MSRFILVLSLALLTLSATPSVAQEPPVPPARDKDVQTTVEYYYRVKWGSLKEFIALYDKNHAPLIEEMKKAGFVVDTKTEYPFTHLAGGPRWDMRVRIVYRDAAAAINDPAWEDEWVKAKGRIYKDLKKFAAEEARRFGLLEDHWDVIVADYPG